MKYRIFVIFFISLISRSMQAGGYYSINIDWKTAQAMLLAYNTEGAMELMGDESVRVMLKHYRNAEIASAGIFMTKYMDYKHLRDAGKFGNAQENAYYKRIYRLVSQNIIPKTIDVAKLMVQYPDRAPYWVPFLIKTTEDTKSLCMQFESVVTNNALSFRDIPFLQISDRVKAMFDLQHLGGVDWKATFDDMTTLADNITKEDLQADLDDIVATGAAIASAGGINANIMNNSHVAGLFGGVPQKIYNLYNNVGAIYEGMAGSGIENIVLGILGSRDSTALLNLFQSNTYDIEQMISDYSTDGENRYYTQRYYIYSQDSGSETLCSYTPPTDDYNVIYGSQWTRFDTTDPNFYPNSAQREQALSNSESYAGWSRSRVNQLNQTNDGYRYNINYYSNAYLISRNGSQYQKAYAYEITVTKNWNHTEEVYEDVFDSYSMDLNAFLSQMNAKLYYYNTQQENGKKYYLGMDSKHYYQATDAAKVKGVSAVTFTVHCTDGQKLGEGSTSWKENGDQGKSLGENSKRYAMETTLTDTNPTSELDQMLSEKQAEIDDLNSQISSLEQEQTNISVQLRDLGYDAGLMARYNEIQSQLNSLEAKLTAAKESYRQIQEASEEAREEFSHETDDVNRIPSIMHDVQAAYRITWQGEGYWSGYEYIRKGKMDGMESLVTFRARLSLQRKPKYFLGIRIHRAILQIDWELTSEYSYSDVVEVMEVDPELDDQQRADVINRRLSEIAQDYPSCTVEAEYRRSTPVEVEDEDDGLPHLLWASERLAIARDIESRLVTIYTKLAMLERYIKTSQSLTSMLFNTVMNGIDHSKRRSIGIEALNRWKESAGQAVLSNTRRRDDETGGDI